MRLAEILTSKDNDGSTGPSPSAGHRPGALGGERP